MATSENNIWLEHQGEGPIFATAVNVFSTGGLDSLEKLEGVPFVHEVIRAIERKVEYRKRNLESINNIEIATY